MNEFLDHTYNLVNPLVIKVKYHIRLYENNIQFFSMYL